MGNTLRKLSRFELNKINVFLSNDLYENELKYTRPAAEVECIKFAVKTYVTQLTSKVVNEDPLCEISHTYLVGSMAEETSTIEPDEFDFMVVLKHFSEPDALRIRLKKDQSKTYDILNNKIPLNKLELSQTIQYIINDELIFAPLFLTTILETAISSRLTSKTEPVTTNHGTLSLLSPIVCHHGPASVLKLKWEPTSELSTSLDILVDITPCIEQHGIDTVIKAEDVAIAAHYEALVKDDVYMLVPSRPYSFKVSFTTTEVKVVQTLSQHHKTCYMILKYYLNSILVCEFLNAEIESPYSSYCIKTFLLRHVDRCKTGECLMTCILDILDDLDSKHSFDIIDGIFGHYCLKYFVNSTNFICEIEDKLCHIGKSGYSVERHEEFRQACHRESSHPRSEDLANIFKSDHHNECHLSDTCDRNVRYEYGMEWN